MFNTLVVIFCIFQCLLNNDTVSAIKVKNGHRVCSPVMHWGASIAEVVGFRHTDEDLGQVHRRVCFKEESGFHQCIFLKGRRKERGR